MRKPTPPPGVPALVRRRAAATAVGLGFGAMACGGAVTSTPAATHRATTGSDPTAQSGDGASLSAGSGSLADDASSGDATLSWPFGPTPPPPIGDASPAIDDSTGGEDSAAIATPLPAPQPIGDAATNDAASEDVRIVPPLPPPHPLPPPLPPR